MYLLDGCNFLMYECLNICRAKISVFLIAEKTAVIGFMNTVYSRVLFFYTSNTLMRLMHVYILIQCTIKNCCCSAGEWDSGYMTFSLRRDDFSFP